MIKKVLAATVGLVALSTTAFAADLPSRRAPPLYAPPIPSFTWTGLYIGGQVGYAFGSDRDFITVPGIASGPFGTKPNGIIGGGHVGYNFSTQGLPVFGGVFGTGGVIGLEGDVDGTDYRRTVALTGISPLFAAGSTGTIRDTIDASIRGRLGIAVDRALFYVTGGAAFADFRTNVNNVGVGSDSFDHTRVGYTVGGGIEYAITNNWSLRAEYRYSDFGRFTDTLNNSSLIAGSTVSHRETIQRAQVGFSYKFDVPGLVPVVAKY